VEALEPSTIGTLLNDYLTGMTTFVTRQRTKLISQ